MEVRYTNPNKLTDFAQTDIEIAIEAAIGKLVGEDCLCQIRCSKHSPKTSRLDINIQFGRSRKPVAVLPDKRPLVPPKG